MGESGAKELSGRLSGGAKAFRTSLGRNARSAIHLAAGRDARDGRMTLRSWLIAATHPATARRGRAGRAGPWLIPSGVVALANEGHELGQFVG
jgi:hypothetical protein